MPTTIQDITAKIGEIGDPLPKLSSREKKEIKTFFRKFHPDTTEISAELLLRAYLLTNEPINSEMCSVKNIASTLKLNDILKNVKKLSQRRSFVSSAAVFYAMGEQIRSFYNLKLDLKTIKSIISSIDRWQKWVESSKSTLTDETEEAVIEQIKDLSTLMPTPKNLDDKNIKKYRNQISPLLSIVLSIASKSNSFKTLQLTIETLYAIREKFPSLIVNDILAEEKLSKQLEIVKRNVFENINYFVKNAETDKLIELYRMTSEKLDIRDDFVGHLKNIWDTQGAMLNEDTQTTIKSILFGETFEVRPPVLVTEVRESATIQIAAALLSSWDARNDSHRALDSFKILKAVGDKFFNLKIGGDVDSSVSFNKIIHETIDNKTLPENTKVKIVRPWIEWENERKKVVLIKALVERVNN